MDWRTVLPVAAAIFLPLSSADARPRDDVMSGAFRCASIADARTWLDCYYGAAQPVRIALTLAPVPAAQARLATSPPAGIPAPAEVRLRDQIMTEAFGCNRLQSEKQWLDCYYTASNPARVRLGLSVSPRAVAPAETAGATRTSVVVPATASAKWAGASHRMTSYEFDRYGIFTVTLENGEVWRQISSDSSFARWNKPASRYVVRIARGALGSFNLQVQNTPGLYKVRRAS